MRYLATLLLALAVTVPALAETRWVGDELIITLRKGQGNQYQILRTLNTGTALEVLEDDGEFTRVRTPKGTEGWVRARYLKTEPVAADRLVQAQAQIEKLQEENRSLQEKLAQLRSERAELGKTVKTQESAQERLSDELQELRELAAAPMQLQADNDIMRTRIEELQSTVQRLESTNETLRDRSRRDWFVAGSGVLGGGIVLGLILPLIRRKKRDRLYDF